MMRTNDRQKASDSYAASRRERGTTEWRGICTAVIGSMTQAMKAQSLLAEAAIRATVTKISSSRTHNGCAYGLDFPCTQTANVRTVLSKAGIRVREYLEG